MMGDVLWQKSFLESLPTMPLCLTFSPQHQELSQQLKLAEEGFQVQTLPSGGQASLEMFHDDERFWSPSSAPVREGRLWMFLFIKD